MSRYTGPKFKIARREGVNLTGTTSKRLEEVLQIPPGGRARPRQRTSYGLRLRGKQRLRNQFGLTERAFRRFFGTPRECPAQPASTCSDCWSGGSIMSSTWVVLHGPRPMARQLVSHGHVLVNRRPVNIASCLVKPGDVNRIAAFRHGNPYR
jgi:small subunit ribosomal protein S4